MDTKYFVQTAQKLYNFHMEEAELVKLCQEGRLENFAHLYDHYLPKIYGFIYYRTKHKETAEDLTSIIFGKALRQINKYDSAKGTFSAWLYKIARNTLIDERRAKRENIDISNIDISEGIDYEQKADQNLRIEKVKKFLDSLTPEQREVVLLRVWDDLPYREIAEIVGKNEANCKMIFSRAIAKIRADGSLALLTLIFLNGK